MLVVSDYTEEEDSAQVLLQYLDRHGHTNSCSLKAMEILAQKFQILFQTEYARKWEERNVFSIYSGLYV